MRRRVLACAAAVVCAALGGVRGSVAASLVLDEAGKREALAYGRASADRDAFDAEWRVKNSAGDVALVLTPFHRLAVAARHAVFRGEPLKESEPDRLLRELKDRLVFQVEVRGPRPTFAQQLFPELMIGDRKLKATFVQNDRTPRRLDDGTFVARCVYWFPTKELSPTSRMELVVRDREEREVSRFAIDLAAMR